MVSIRVGEKVELREAYEKLGVEPGIEPKSARRAYLKLLKVHKPEIDPEGFKVIREAWERIKDAPDWEIRALTEAPLEQPADGPSVSWSKPKRSWAEQAQLSREGKLFENDAPAPAPPPPPKEIDPDAPLTMATFYARCSGATDAQRVAIGREAVAALPDDPESHWLLHESLLVTSQMAEAAQVLREAHERGLDGFFEPLVRQHPEHLLPMEIAAAVERCGESLDALMVAEALLRCDQAQGAADAMRRGLEAARRGGEPPSARRSIDLVLRLFRQGHAGIAHQLHARLSEWLRESGAESEIAGTQAAASYALLRELAALPSSFPFEVSAAIARGILDGDVAFAVGEVAGWLDAHPKHREDVASKLAILAPTIHRSLGPALAARDPANRAYMPAPIPVKPWGGAPSPPTPGAAAKPTGKYGKWIALAIALFVFVGVQMALRDRNRPRPEFPRTTFRGIDIPSSPLGIPPSDSLIRLVATQVCVSDPHAEACIYARGLSQALRDRDCVGSRDQYAGFEMALEATEATAIDGEIVVLRHAKGTFDNALRERCPSAP